MTNFKKYEIGQSLKLQIDFDEFLSLNHFGRQIEQIVSELNIDDLLTSYKKEGQNAYHPRMLLSIIFYGYMTGIRSGRKLEASCRTDLVFIYLSKCNRLGKSTINDFRKNHYVHFESLFVQVLQKCQEGGIVDACISIADGSKINANGSKKRSKTKRQFEKWQQCLTEDLTELHQAAAAVNPSVDLSDSIEKKERQKKKLKHLF